MIDDAHPPRADEDPDLVRLRIQARLHDGVVPVPFLGTTWQQRGAAYWRRRTGAVVLLIALTVFVGASPVAATSTHWIDLSIGLPRLHASIHPGGSLAVFRNIFGDAGVDTEFRDRVRQIVARRENDEVSGPPPELRPTMRELAAEGLFLPMRTERWKWAIELTTPR